MKERSGEGAKTSLHVVDVSVESEVAAAFQEAASQLGGLDTVVANAGIQLFGRDAPVDELELDAWQLTIDVNLTGMFLTCKYGVKELLRAGGGVGYLPGLAYWFARDRVAVPRLLHQ